MSDFVHVLFWMSIKTSVLIFIILIVKSLFHKFFTAKTHYAIWFLLFISLTVACTPKSDISIYNLTKHFNQTIQLSQNQLLDSANKTNQNLERSHWPSKRSTLNGKTAPFIATPAIANTPNAKSKILNLISTLYTSPSLANIITYIWLLGVLLLTYIVAMKTIRFNQLIAMEEEILATEKLALLKNCKTILGVDKDVKLVKTKNFSTPSLVGMFSPKIMLPEQILANFDDEKLELILLHELAHLKRKDLLMNWLILIYQLAYWFNPVVWIGFYKMRNDMELACDSFVLEHLQKEKHIFYGKVIIELLEYFSNQHFVPVVTNILENKNEVTRRIIMIKNFNKASISLTLISLLLIALVGCSSISSAQPATDPQPAKESEKANQEMLIENQYCIDSSVAQKVFSDKNDIIGKDSTHIWEMVKTPYVNTYYVDTLDRTQDEISSNYTNEAIYPIKGNDKNSALYVFVENNTISDIKIDAFSGLPSNSFKDSDYKVNCYSGGHIDEKGLPYSGEDIDSTKLEKEFSGKSLSDFNHKFKLTRSSNEVINKAGTQQLSVYPIVSKDYPSPFVGIYVISEENIIKKIEIDRAVLQFEKLDEHFSLTAK